MVMRLYKLRFQKAHFGAGYLNTSRLTFSASVLYSALYLEAIENNCLSAWQQIVNQPDFALSNAFPYCLGQPYLPVPLGFGHRAIKLATLLTDYRQQKVLAQLRFISLNQLANLLNYGTRLSVEELTTELLEQQAQLAKQAVFLKKGQDPYEVGVTTYHCDLYVIATASSLLDQLMTSLQYRGLGGERTSGYGCFKLEIEALPEPLQAGLGNKAASWQLLLTDSLPSKTELTEDLMTEARGYRLLKSSGYTLSDSASQPLRKKNLYKIQAGAVFNRRYQGQIYDVRPEGFPHPVYNYAKGMFYGLKEEAR